MSEPPVIVWDLETVPDLKAAARMFGMDGKPDDEVRESLGSGFPKHPLHRIACIGALVAKREPDGWRVSALGAPHTNERPEPEPTVRAHSCHNLYRLCYLSRVIQGGFDET
jgi:hypothetical protein